MKRRAFLMRAGMAALGRALPASSLRLHAPAPEPDYRLAIGTARFEVARNRFLTTLAYNGQVPGPLLRATQGKPLVVEVTNRTAQPDIVHWHGLHLPVATDGAMEEGTPMIAPGATTRLEIVPDVAGLRWYHTHTFAGSDTRLGQFSGRHGMLLVAPAGVAETPDYDREVPLVLHDWDAKFMGSDDGAMTPDYNYSTINARTEGLGDPLRVKQGERILFHILNASATDVHWLSFTGHTFEVIALDGNALAQRRKIAMLRVAPGERVGAIVAMDSPGKWVLAEPRKHVRSAGMGMHVEYAGATGSPQWRQPDDLVWSYAAFTEPAPSEGSGGGPPETIPIRMESRFRGHGAPEEWLMNGYPYPQPASPVLHAGTRYRLRFDNRSVDDHPMHLHRHRFRIISMAGKSFRGPLKDTVVVPAKTIVEVDFPADNPGNTLLHCHQQDHMDHGFMMVLRYA